MKHAPVSLSMACLLAVSAMPAGAQNADLRNRVVVVENVRYDYAQVLNVEPVFQTLRATRTEEHCEPVSTLTLAPVEVKGEEQKGGFRRFWDSVKGIFSHQDGEEEADAEVRAAGAGNNGALLTPNAASSRWGASSAGPSPTTWITSTRASSSARACPKTPATASSCGCRSPPSWARAWNRDRPIPDCCAAALAWCQGACDHARR
ncbi:hypothetical protein AOT14_15960 [Stenotrophomonas acidaminiphila]|uniref:Uncharacterized protein n=1 Tax=Stenotrophomonas acidaminiphila TaxID=128780 RepID=A0A0S1AZ17_9GAMM|nr:hypothetical protein AOT14_15960 [Stenotrophomonas acidaminiphila]